MSSNDEAAEQMAVAIGKSKEDDAKMEHDTFIKHLTVERDFKLSDDGNIIQIRHLPVSKCTVPLLRRICVKFKVSGYKNQNKERTLALLKNLVMREALKNNIYKNDDNDSASTVSEASLEECGQDVTLNEEDKDNDSIDDDTDSSYQCTTRSNSAATSSNTHGTNNNDERAISNVVDDKINENNRVRAAPTTTKTRTGTTVSNGGGLDDGKVNDQSVAGSASTTGNRKKKKKPKGTAPNAVTCMNTYFRAINVYMCQKNRSLVMDLGRPPNKANLDSRTSPHRHVYEALLMQYLDKDDGDAAVFAFPDHVFWTFTGVDHDVASSEFDSALTANDFEAILEYINHHYQVAHRKNKQSGSHADFENFVGARYFLFYYHLWLKEAPNLLNFAVPELPSAVFRESFDSDIQGEDDSHAVLGGDGNNISDVSSATTPGRKKRKGKQMKSHAVEETSVLEMAAQKQFGDALLAFQSAQSEKSKSLRDNAAPRREQDLLGVFSEYKDRLKTSRLELNTAMNSATYDSDDSDVVNLKREIALCKRKRDEIFDLLSGSDLK